MPAAILLPTSLFYPNRIPSMHFAAGVHQFVQMGEGYLEISRLPLLVQASTLESMLQSAEARLNQYINTRF